MNTLLILVLVIGSVLLLWVISVYNRFIRLKNMIEVNKQQIRVALKKRLDLLTQLVSAVQSEMKFERDTLETITRLRSRVSRMSDHDLVNAEAESRNLLSALNVQMEAYPALKSSEAVQKLMQQSKEVEDEISRLRYVYNNTVQDWNTLSQLFPTNILANLFGFGKQSYLTFQEDLDHPPLLTSP